MDQPHTLTLDDVFFDKNTGSIGNYFSNYKNIVIPSDFNGDPVIAIGVYAFSDHFLTNVIISSSITSIGHYAFLNNALTKVTISSSRMSIGNHAFDETVTVTRL